jgi:hypothetical protein
MTVFGEEADTHGVLRTKAHKEGAQEDISEADDAAQCVDRYSQADLLLHLDYDGLPLFGEVGTLGGDKESIQVFLHGSPRIRAR